MLSFGDGYVGAASGGITDNKDDVYMAKNTMSWTRGRSNWKFGGEYRWNHLHNRTLTNTQGALTFSNLATAQPGSPAGSGNSFASFLLGEVASGNIRFPQNLGIRRTYSGFFVQNDFKASRKLTLNLGLRWEFMGAPFEQQDRYSVVDLNRPNPAAGNRSGALIFAGTGEGRTGARRLLDRDNSGGARVPALPTRSTRKPFSAAATASTTPTTTSPSPVPASTLKVPSKRSTTASPRHSASATASRKTFRKSPASTPRSSTTKRRPSSNRPLPRCPARKAGASASNTISAAI
ncbi:MAG: hypothetical protein B7X34_02805 [Acidobacteriia bacterium 12-62-4]|nr:MAG: hypothetical protein B7X34_02805 [Acidobacteriia bacterium 12-62-4]